MMDIFRAILFLIIPIIILWIIPYYNVSVYIWSYYVLITQATILCTIIDEKNNIHKRLVIFMILVPCTCVHASKPRKRDLANLDILKFSTLKSINFQFSNNFYYKSYNTS